MCLTDWADERVDATLGTSAQVRDAALWGHTEFRVTGSRRSCTRSDRLAELDVPTLFGCGAHDSLPPRACARRTPGSCPAGSRRSSRTLPARPVWSNPSCSPRSCRPGSADRRDENESWPPAILCLR